MKIKASSKSKKRYCFKVVNTKNKYLEGVFPFSKEGKAKAIKFASSKDEKYKIIKAKV